MPTCRRSIALSLLFAVLSLAARGADPEAPRPAGDVAATWLESSLKRVFPTSVPPDGAADFELLSAREARTAFQACLRNGGTAPLRVECSVVGADDLKPRVRLVGLVPMRHHTPATAASELDGAGAVPGLIPDPLYPETAAVLGPRETGSFWITLAVPADARPGPRELTVRLAFPEVKARTELKVKLEVSPLVVRPRRDFPVTHWWRGEATWDYYKTGMFEDDRWWTLTRAQLEDMLAHGSDVVYVPVFFDRRETFKRPCQLLVVTEPRPGTYAFDWSRVKRFTDMAKSVGFRQFEWSHLWIYWGVENAMRVYTKKDGQ